MDIQPIEGTPVPAWQVGVGDTLMLPAGAAARVRTRAVDVEEDLRGGMTFTGWCAGPTREPQPWGTPGLPEWSLECLSSDLVDLAEDHVDTHMASALSAAGLVAA